MSKNYYNWTGDPIYVLHFPGNGMLGSKEHMEENIDRKISISDEISIISIMNKVCYDTSVLRQQCDNNQIKIINTAYDVENWINTIKIPHILQSLSLVDTRYCLILDGRDTLLVNDIDDTFIDTYKSLGAPIIYNATDVRYPKTRIEPLQDIIKIKTKHRYLNAGVCVGKTESLIDFYTKAEKILKQHPDNDSEQYIIRLCRQQYPELANFDYDCKLFAVVHHCGSMLVESDGGYVFH